MMCRRYLTATVVVVFACGVSGAQRGGSGWLETVQGNVQVLSFSPDGKRLAAGGWDQAVRVWDLAKPEKPSLELGKQDGGVRGLAFSPDGKLLAGATTLGWVAVWDAADGKRRWKAQLAVRTPRAAFSPDGKVLAVVGEHEGAGVMHLCDSETGKVTRTIKADESFLDDVTFAPDGKSVAAVGTNSGVHIWDAGTGKLTRTFAPPSRVGVAFSPDGKRIYSGGSKRVFGWDTRSGELVLNLDALPVEDPRVALSADGKRLSAGGGTRLRPSANGQARCSAFVVWDAGSGKEISRFAGFDKEDAIGGLFHVALSPDGKTLAAAGAGHLSLYDAGTGERQRQLLKTVERPFVPKK
jgi:WD40 repeat protein